MTVNSYSNSKVDLPVSSSLALNVEHTLAIIM